MRQLLLSDVEAMMRLKEAAGWNQTEADLVRNLALEPEGCFAIDCDGRLASTAAVIAYGRELAWIGMVLTDPQFRGRGFARQLFAHALNWLDSRGVVCSKLDATTLGEPLYRSFGFEAECVIERWVRKPLPYGRGSARTTTLNTEPRPSGSDIITASLDRRVFAADRSALLSSLAQHGSINLGGGQYAMSRSGSKAAYFGPMIALDKETAQRGLEWFLHASGDALAYWDLFPSNTHAVELARQFGFEPARQLLRMRRGNAATPALANIYAIAGFEYG
jgi:GNAT superfamily N-acetyltransferase